MMDRLQFIWIFDSNLLPTSMINFASNRKINTKEILGYLLRYTVDIPWTGWESTESEKNPPMIRCVFKFAIQHLISASWPPCRNGPYPSSKLEQGRIPFVTPARRSVPQKILSKFAVSEFGICGWRTPEWRADVTKTQHKIAKFDAIWPLLAKTRQNSSRNPPNSAVPMMELELQTFCGTGS